MIGFLKRDAALLRPTLKFYLIFVLGFAVLSVFTDFSTSFASLYLVIFSASGIMGLFSYDDMNHWQGYAAAAPNGRSAMVNARYLLSVLIGLGVFLIQLLLGLFDRANDPLYALLYSDLYFFHTALLYAGAFLLYAAILLPVSYRFGGMKSRIIMIVVIAALSVLIALLPALLRFNDGRLTLPDFLPALVPAAGAAALALSWRLSLHIMAKKEL